MRTSLNKKFNEINDRLDFCPFLESGLERGLLSRIAAGNRAQINDSCARA